MPRKASKGSTLDPTDILAPVPTRGLDETEDPETGLALLANKEADTFGSEEEAEQIEIERDLLEKRIVEDFTPEFVKLLRRISYFISKVGLPLQEALQLVQIPETEFATKMRLYPVIGELIALKELEFKADILGTIAAKARTGNDKLATWLLQAKYPQEFNQKRGSAPGSTDDDDNLIAMGVEFVQQHGDSNPMVNQTAGRAFLVTKGSGEGATEMRKTIRDLLDNR